MSTATGSSTSASSACPTPATGSKASIPSWPLPAAPVNRGGKDAFAIRFHLNPGVQAARTASGRGVMLELADGETWEFQTDGLEAEIEDSILISNTRGNRKTVQIVIHGRVQQTPRVAWRMHRTAVGGRRRAAPAIADRRANMPARG